MLAASAAAALAGDTLEVFGLRWRVPAAKDWKIEDAALHLVVPTPAEPSPKPRRPIQFALAETPAFQRVTVEAEIRQEPAATRGRRTSIIFVYAYRDPDHFNYVHFSVDEAKRQPVHNGFFHVYGGDRVRISSEDGPATLIGEGWHKVRLVYDGLTGKAEAWVDGKTSPSMRAVDLSLGAGRVGIGSFFDLGSFRNVKITGDAAN
jgi:hypothetical protein